MRKFAFLMAASREDYHTYKPLCFGYLASYLARHVPEVEVGVFQDAGELIDWRPDAAGFSATTTNFKLAEALARQTKDALGIPTLIGGVHVTVLPHRMPEVFDVGVLGEGEETTRELARLLVATGRFDPADLARIDGVCYRDGSGALVSTAPRELIHPLDTIPRPDRRAIGYAGERAYMFTSRGCPYDCRFCSSQKHWGRYRTFSPEYVLEEIEELVRDFGATEIHFFDDLFVANKKRLSQIADGIVARGWQKSVEFSCTIRANVADEALMETLARMEIRRVTFGAESNSDPILRYLKGDNVTAEMNQRALDLCHAWGIRVGPSFIKGAPQETGDDVLATYDFILRNIRAKKIDYFEIHNLTPFPGTPIWDHALARGIVTEEMDFDELKVPWEKLYLNERIPKSSFYFLESLTKKGQEMLGIFGRRIVGIADAGPRISGLDEKRADWIADCVGRLRADRFLDEVFVVALGDGVSAEARTYLDAAGVALADPQALARFESDPKDDNLIVYFELSDGFDPQVVYNAVWHHFDEGADLTRFSETRHFLPVNEFERRVFVFSPRAFARAIRKVVVEGRGPAADLGAEFLTGEFKVAIYRPDDDPWAEARGAARLLRKRLFADFDLDKMNRRQQARRIPIIEERIIQKTEALPRLEARRRRLAESPVGRRVRESDSGLLKGLVKFFLYRD